MIACYIKRYPKTIDGYATLISSGIKPGELYGLTKVHEDNS